MPKSSVYLVFDDTYQVVGVASTERQSYAAFNNTAAVRVIGPVEVDSPIDWGSVQEDHYGPDLGPVKDFNSMKDGVPMPEPSSYDELGIKHR